MKNLYRTLSGYANRTKAFAAIFSLMIMLGFSQQVFAEANYVYHEQTTNNPGCGPNYMSTTSPTNAAGVQLAWKIEYQFYTTNTVVYYTTDGSTPSGAFGVGTGTTQVLTGSYNCTFPFVTNVDVATATIPAQAPGTVIKYIISAWHSGGGNEIFANGPGAVCGCGTPTNSAALATLFSYTVAPAGNVTVYSGGGTGAPFTNYATLAAAITAINGGTAHTGTITAYILNGYTETVAPTGIALTATGTAANPITIKKAISTGANPVLNAGIGTATPSSAAPDGIFSLRGSDYVTIDGITFTDGNTTNPATMEFGVGLFKASAGNGCLNNTIQNCIFNMQRVNNASSTAPMVEGSVGILVINSTAIAATTSLTPTNGGTDATNGTNSGNKFYKNTINGGNYGIALSGFAASSGVGPAPTATTFLGDLNNDIGGSISTNGNTILNFGGGGTTSSSAGIRANNQWGINISYNTVNNNNGSGVNHATTLRGIYAQAGTSGNATISNNTVTIQSGATTSSAFGIDNGIGSTAASNTININSNTINCNYSTATTGVYTAISNSATAATVNINSNTVTKVASGDLAGTGTHVIIETGSPTTANSNSNNVNNISRSGASGSWRIIKTTSPSTWNCSSNTIDGMSWTNTASTGSTDGIYSLSSAVTVNITGNTVKNFSTPTTGTLRGIVEFGSSGAKTIQNNQVFNFSTTSGGVGGASFTGISLQTGTTNDVSGNVVNSLNSTGSTGGTAGVIVGISVTSGTTNNIYKNKIYDLSSTSTNPVVSGITLSGGTTANIYNNLIGDLRATAANAANPLIGLNITGGTTVNAYYNTVNIAGTSTGALFGSSAVSVSTSPTLTLRNNIFVNTSTVNGAAFTAAYRRSSTTLTSYSASSNNNLFYAGTPSATNVIYYDGTTAQSTMTAYKALVSTRDAASVTENPTWQSTSGASANFLKYSVAVATQIESGGAAIVGFTDDFTGTTRNASTPDIGAWELAGITADLVGPTIAYTAIPNSAVAGTQSFSSVTITDLSGVNGTSGTRPRVYYKLTTNANTFNDNTNATDGWKYVEANGSTSPFDFTIDYSKLFGGAGIAIGNTVQYFVVAQDNAGTPNIGINNGVFAATPTSVALTSAAFPLTGTINQFNIVSSISGTFTVCTSGCDYTSLTNAGGAFADINAKLVSGNIILNINGDLTAETAANGLNEFASPYTITIQPNGGATRTISGSVSSAALIKLNGADRVTINGLNTGGNALNITNTATTAPTVISLVSLGTGAGATSNTVTNTTLSTGVATTIGYGISIGGSTPGSAGADNDNNTISNNTITAAPVGIYANGTASVTSGGNDNLSISGNSISYNSTLSGVIGIQLANSLNATVSQNTLNITTSASTAPVGISLETGFVSSSVSRNTITQILATNTGGYGGRGITVGTGTATSALTISNNMIYGVNGSNWSSFGNSSSMGIAIGTIGGSSTLTTTTGGVNLYYNSVNMTGSMGSGSTTALTASLYVGSGASSIDIRNNVFVNTQVGTSTTQKNYAIYSAAANTAFSNINYNDYFVSNTFNTASAILGFLTSDRTDLAGIIAGFGGNANSINKDPQFVSSTNLHVNTAVTSYLESAATTIAGITTDYDGDTRNATTPDIGLDEGAFTAPVTNDLQATAFISPVALGSVVTGVSFTPQASFTNNGTATQTSVTVRYRIVDATLTEVYNNTQVIASIASGVTTNISFASTSLAAAGTYTIYAKAELVGDAVTGNDQISSTLTAEAPLCGTYAIGASQPVGYQNLTQAAAKINGLGVSCAVTFALQSDYTSASETYPIVFNQYTGASAINTLTIKPATGVTATISGSLASNALIRLNGADYIIIDGSNNGSTSRDLTINNTNTTAPSGIALVSLGTGLGATNNTIKNLTITTGVSTTLGYGIAAGGATPGTAGDDNDNTIIQNNAITSPGTGIYVGAGATGLNNNLDINNNNITYSGSLSSVIGIQVLQATGASVSQNTINITTSATTAPVGISIETGVVNSTISRNTLGTIISTNTGGYAGRGITIGTGNASSNITVSNNMIYGVNGSNWSSFGNSSAMGIAIGVIGGSSTLTTTAGGINLYYNSISMNGSMGSGSTSALTTALYIGSGASALDIRNNILANTQVGTSTTQKNYAIYSAATSAAFTNINYNDYYVTNTFNAGSAILGNIGATDRTTIGAIQTGFGGNTNSIITNPNFVNAASNLHINTAALSPVDNTGTPVAVTTDFDGDSRSATTPDMGLDEMTSCLNITVYADADGDTYGNPAVTAIDCDGGAPPAGYVLNNSDCDDTNAAINPTTTWYLDADADLYYTGTGVTSCTSPGVGYAYTGLTAGGDCNDANSAINPGATEICNGVDDDCDGSTDEGVTLTFYADTDGDTYGDPASTTTACSAPIGYVANNTDCNDANAAINPGATEVCNLVDDDCDGLTDEGVTTVFYADADGDGFGDAASTTNACTAPSGYVADNTDCNDALITYADLDGDTYGAGAMVACGVANNTDCDDSDAAVNPGATEICNGIDDDCDGNIDEAGAVGESTWYADADGDTYGDAASSITACTAPVGYVGANDDCDDTNAAINPGATEICNGVDDDCDGSTDEGLTYYTYYADAEGDGFGDPFNVTASCLLTPPTGYVADNSDCQPLYITYADADGDSFGFGAPVPCGPVINNVDCDDTQWLYQDSDGDGYGAGAPVECGVPTNTDCAPFNAAINPGATEVCNAIDDDCDGFVDDGLMVTYYADTDGDTYGDPFNSVTTCSGAPVGYVLDNTDCEDIDADIHPGATEVCNGLDDDCNGLADDGLVFITYYSDSDSDGYGDPLSSSTGCSAPVGFVTDNTDCNDANAAINPGATEICNGIDDDCDGTADDGLTFTTYYVDVDGDGYGNPAVSVSTCDGAPFGYVTDNTDCEDNIFEVNPATVWYLDNDADLYYTGTGVTSCTSPGPGYVYAGLIGGGDCNDGDTFINPGATEICNGIDDDCNGSIDDGLTFITYYADADGDTYGDAGSSVSTCDGVPMGYVADNTDCNDSDAAINPAATEICNGIDDDCDGSIDEGLTFLNYYVDADGDGYGDASASPVNSCSPVAGYVTNNLDCNDSNNLISPAGTEICNGVDDNCDGTVDDGILYTIYYADADGDTYGDAGDAVSTCDGAPMGYVADNTDCNDANAAVNPGATEICNGIDDDCDGSTDEGLTLTTYYADVDGDTYGDAFNTTTTCDGIPSGYVVDNTDCDDTQNTVYPGAPEICDGLDNDCDGEYDEGTVTATVTPSGTIAICKGDPTALNANTGVGYTYQWFKNGNVIVGATGATYFATKPGNYQVQVNIPEGCFALSAPTTVQVNPQPNANISAPNGTSLCTTVKLKASYDATYTWQWYKNGSPVGGATSYLYIATTPGSYECVITNAFGCTRTTAAITVTACREGETVETAVEETFELYPNPTESIFTLDMELNSTEQEASVYILSLIGEQVYAGTVGVDHGTVNTTITLGDDVAAGMYVVKVIVAEKEYTKQLMIQK